MAGHKGDMWTDLKKKKNTNANCGMMELLQELGFKGIHT